VHDRFRIAVGSEAVTALLESRAEFGMVVDFPIEYDPHAPVFIRHWLMSTGQVNNAQAAEAKRQRAGKKPPLIVWPTVTENVRHDFQLFCWNVVPSQVENSANSTHCSVFSLELDSSNGAMLVCPY